MNLAILHYHLSHGGVVRVIANHLQALQTALPADQSVRVALLHGPGRAGWPDEQSRRLSGIQLQLRELPALSYDTGAPNADALAADCQQALDSLGFEPAQTVLHVHNHSLGKNLSLPGALTGLAQAGYSLLLHIHDFAEDFRPENYRLLGESLAPGDIEELPRLLYPQMPQIHYAVLNQRDYQLLCQAGIATTNLHFLPNPVPDLSGLPDREQGRAELFRRFGVNERQRYVLYPVRGIRRKNVGEVLLWSVLSGAQSTFSLSLPAENPRALPIYEMWKAQAASRCLPILFETGVQGGLDFGHNLAAADAILTTSLAEGFGMVFLESWLAGRPLIGRDLPEITADFSANGIELGALQPRLLVPLSSVGKSVFARSLASEYACVRAAYQQPAMGSAELQRGVDRKVHDGWIDFGDLNEEMQCRVLDASADTRQREQIGQANPWLEESLVVTAERSTDRIAANAAAIRTFLGTEISGQRLLKIYRQVLASPRAEKPQPPEHPQAILSGFLNLDRFRLLRT